VVLHVALAIIFPDIERIVYCANMMMNLVRGRESCTEVEISNLLDGEGLVEAAAKTREITCVLRKAYYYDRLWDKNYQVLAVYIRPTLVIAMFRKNVWLVS